MDNRRLSEEYEGFEDEMRRRMMTRPKNTLVFPENLELFFPPEEISHHSESGIGGEYTAFVDGRRER
jgi:hypothetical protein